MDPEPAQGAVAQVAQAEAGLTQAQITLSRTRIVAPELIGSSLGVRLR
jgi:multidrug resistance efflux pump